MDLPAPREFDGVKHREYQVALLGQVDQDGPRQNIHYPQLYARM